MVSMRLYILLIGFVCFAQTTVFSQKLLLNKPEPVFAKDGFHQGMVLGLYSRDEDYDYREYLEEIKAVGAESVAFIVVLMQHDIKSMEIGPRDNRTVSDKRLGITIKQAREIGLETLVFPIVLLEEAGPKEWRGKLLLLQSIPGLRITPN